MQTSSELGVFATFAVALVVILVVSGARQRGRHEAAQKQALAQAEAHARIAAIESGKFDEVAAAGVVPLPGERFFFAESAQHGQFYQERVTRGSNPALYIPLGHGYRLRAGSFTARSGASENFRWDAIGTLYFSNVRLAFKPNDSPALVSIPYSTVLSYDAHPDGLALNVDKVGVQQFKTPNDCAGVLFQKIIQQRIPGIGALEPSTRL
jgi:hypothetical protein